MKRRSPCKILIIEPMQDTQMLLSEILEANDCIVDVVDKAGAGVEIAHKNQYHIIICRNSLTVSSGLLIYKELKSHLAKTGTAFFLLINQNENKDLYKGLELGIDNFIEIPINKVVLINKINNQISKSREYEVFESTRFKDYFNNSPVAMFTIKENEIVEINNAFRDLFKMHWRNIKNSDFYDILKFSGEPKNITKYYKLKKGSCESCILKNIRLIDSFILNFEIFLYKSNSDSKGKIFAEILPSDINLDKIIGRKSRSEINNNADANDTIQLRPIHREINFTEREYEVYKLSAQGLPIKQIASKLSLSSRTVEKHRQNIMKKTNAHNIVEAIRNVQKAYSLLADQIYDVE